MSQILKTILRWAFRILFRVEIQGRWPDPLPQRLLIVANHESFLDGVLLALFLPANPVFVLHTWVAQSRFYGWIIRFVDYLAVDPTNPMAIKQVVKLVEAGRPVVIFPEGRITVTGSLMKVYDGPAFVAAHTGADILPVRLDGPSLSYFSRLGGGHPRHFLPKLRLTLMPLEKIDIPPTESPHERRRQAGEALRRLMQHMLFASRPAGTLYEALLDSIAVWGRKHRLIEDIRQIEHSYGEFLKMTLALGRLGCRLAPKDARIGVLLPNAVPTLALITGLGAMRRIPAMLNYTAGQAGIEAACELAQIKVIITSRAFEEGANLHHLTHGLARNFTLLYLEDLRPQFSLRDKLWLLCALCAPRRAVPFGQAEEEAITLFTSGSEGTPKGVVLSHRNLLANLAQIRSVIAFNASDKFLSALPLFHAFGLTAGALLPLLTGTRLFLYPSPLHYRVIPELAYDRDCTVLFGTSTFLGHYAKHAHPYDFYRVRYVVAGAERLAQRVRETWFEKFGIRILEGYGTTETSPVLSVNTPMAYQTGSVGQFLPGIDFWLEPVPDFPEGGILHVRGPNVMKGYLLAAHPGRIEPVASSRGPGWYCTGDIVSIDENGFVTIKGRVKRFAKIAGEMVSLEAVENLAHTIDPLALHAACSRMDESRGESLILFTTSPLLTQERLQATARQHGLPALLVPRDIRVQDSLPQLGSGKIDYVALKQRIDKGSTFQDGHPA
ncbi:acyl-[acyl-carrier-protein]-phospholipid O-acyltransferase / long-chain-fatty-acid--[acyl-carrier-protein] ligase [Formivibrio citricus]|uniref:Acyl-[acyl-carrier-protein]-phospholipid O-acyltransferase / long-chain-fatty-acid--[acyl-carrier-protein] ligase n=1 Tax=Formivibrio citricus TaxID=83765 RepID=A0A1I5D3A8_9NEIS|nr:bifunctional acyl-ACP--phospholipid O-acyltransferase/long-chain-fatty-acid--ACP ligase [Formivibrio citricus]SFN93728.1 acyl-[acyl-carrier-protein]-phospholipid O-acyltransferase / long-chain-fatty-acid--[acyl-carrier-protein] ligase [Formivibrio citricus]